MPLNEDVGSRYLTASPFERSDLLKEDRCRLLKYLPDVYADHFFLRGFLNIIDSIWQPLGRQIDELHTYFDPRLTPAEFLPWLGTWLDLGTRRELARDSAPRAIGACRRLVSPPRHGRRLA